MTVSRKRITLAEVFERDVWSNYFDGMDAAREGRFADAEHAFNEATRLNPRFPGSYELLAVVAEMTGDADKAEKMIDRAFAVVLAAYPRWPKRLPWGVLENRPVLRIIQMKAMRLHEKNERMEAEKLYRLLLQLNPSDNQGIRFLLPKLRKGLPPEDEE